MPYLSPLKWYICLQENSVIILDMNKSLINLMQKSCIVELPYPELFLRSINSKTNVNFFYGSSTYIMHLVQQTSRHRQLKIL